MDASEQFYVALQHAARRFRAMDEELGLSTARFAILATLRYEGPQRIGQLARAEGVSQPTMTQSVQGLEAAGLVVRRVTPEDGRGCAVELTPAGRALVRRARARKIAWLDQLLRDLPDDQKGALKLAAEALDNRTSVRYS
jgi:DNA-binding MarR family transcriptional regulator